MFVFISCNSTNKNTDKQSSNATENNIDSTANDKKIIELNFGFKVILEEKSEVFDIYKTYNSFKLIRGEKVLYLDNSLEEYEFENKLFPILLKTGNNNFELLVEINNRPNKNYLKRMFIQGNEIIKEDKLPTFEAAPRDINNDGIEEYAGYWFYAEIWGKNDSLTSYNPILYYSITETGLQLDSALTKARNEIIYGTFFDFSYSEKYKQPISVTGKFDQEIKFIKGEL